MLKTVGPKRTFEQREMDLAETAKLDRRGWSERDIAAKLGVTPRQIYHDLKTIHKRYAQSVQADRAALVAEKRLQYAELRKEAFEQWECSKKAAKKRVTESEPERDCGPCQGLGVKDDGTTCKTCHGKATLGGITRITESVEWQTAATEYLRVVEATYDAERKMLGLDAAKEISLTGTLDWNVLIAAMGGPNALLAEEVDTVEAKLKAALEDPTWQPLPVAGLIELKEPAESEALKTEERAEQPIEAPTEAPDELEWDDGIV